MVKIPNNEQIENISREDIEYLTHIMDHHFWDEYKHYLEDLDVDKKLMDKIDYLSTNKASPSLVMNTIPNDLHNKNHRFYNFYKFCYSQLYEAIADYEYEQEIKKQETI